MNTRPLTERQQAVLDNANEDLTQRELAAKIGLTRTQVHSVIMNLQEKEFKVPYRLEGPYSAKQKTDGVGNDPHLRALVKIHGRERLVGIGKLF